MCLCSRGRWEFVWNGESAVLCGASNADIARWDGTAVFPSSQTPYIWVGQSATSGGFGVWDATAKDSLNSPSGSQHAAIWDMGRTAKVRLGYRVA